MHQRRGPESQGEEQEKGRSGDLGGEEEVNDCDTPLSKSKILGEEEDAVEDSAPSHEDK